VGEQRFGSYVVRRELGSGALSTVYQAVHETLSRKVAIKALKPTVAPTSSFAAPLEREARVLAELSHPNIVALYDFVKTESQMYLVLEYIRGFSLAEVLAKKPRLRPEVVAGIGVEVARALAHAHERAVVHRDVKPANVLLTREGGVKLVDFGIAQRARLPTGDEPLGSGPQGEVAEQTFGTPAYMAPEQILGDDVDARSDVFSLGVVLYQLLSGARPFDRTEGQESLHRMRREPAVPLRSRAPDVPRELERIVMRAIEKLPADRWPTARAMATELEGVLRARSAPATTELVLGALAAAGLLPSDVPRPPARRSCPLPRRHGTSGPRASFPSRRCWLGSPWRTSFPRAGSGVVATSVEGPLGAVRAPHGEVRVLATPWAEVAVDGQPYDVTPLGRAVALAPGVHFVTLTHPSAPPVTKRVVVVAGETQTIDVTMDVGGARASREDGGGGEP
jgi:serine/threonine protein kinase